LILLGVPPLGGYNYITPRRAGLSATAGLPCLNSVKYKVMWFHRLDNKETGGHPSVLWITYSRNHNDWCLRDPTWPEVAL